MNNSTLNYLSRKPDNLTDKADDNHTFDGLNYLHVYEQYFASRRRTALALLEIGVLNGGSLRLWRDYFDRAQVYGMDIDPARSVHAGNRIQIRIGDQSDAGFLEKFGKEVQGFDIVIDDGSHITSYILESFRCLWPFVRKGGLYAIEDLRISYEPMDNATCYKFWPGMTYNGDVAAKRHSRSDIESKLVALIRELDNKQGDVRAIHVHSMMVIIEKATL